MSRPRSTARQRDHMLKLHAERDARTADAAELERRRALANADAAVADLKQAVSGAALQCIRGSLDAPRHVRAALALVDRARDALRIAREVTGSPREPAPSA